MKKIVFLMPLSKKFESTLMEAAPGWTVIHGKDPSVWLPHLKDAKIVAGWNRQAEAECFRSDSQLKWVHNWGAGVNNLPLAKFKERGIILTNSSGVHSFQISETILAMMLSLTRKIDTYVRNQMRRKWHHANNVLEMHGKTVGIIGVGAIGEETARLARAFGMTVLGVRRSGEPLPHVDEMYTMEGLHEVLGRSDYVVVTVPLTQETRHMFGEKEFQAMKSSAYFINIGRGETVDTAALIHALNENQIAGAGLDVFEQEPLPEDHPMWEMENVIITPHTAGSSEHYNERAFHIFLPNLKDFLEGRTPSRNVIDLDLGY